ncbi:transcription antitermination factor NusB [Corynebacterium gerontici]|uniref:Transcription antitermination protein NusB n=1 Tax=Corynebacterium gerontici TaxID=2079234 RepID=A0A3G6J0S1_9CORY|nr:transcription antitermination factor NusB [Corynebacterium gerontici]AZA11516.1 hypothetical protein CGERO_06045 [Corynebacterium gerontici]
MTDSKQHSRVPRHKRHGSRYRARLRAAQVLYEAELRDVDPVRITEDRTELARANVEGVAPVAAYGQEIVAGAAEELDRIDELIAANLSEDWEIERISAVDRAVLRVAIWELVFNPEIPVKTAISDAVEMAFQLSQDDSPKYINAMLDAIAQRIEDVRAASSLEQPVEEDPENTIDGEPSTAEEVPEVSNTVDEGIADAPAVHEDGEAATPEESS